MPGKPKGGPKNNPQPLKTPQQKPAQPEQPAKPVLTPEQQRAQRVKEERARLSKEKNPAKPPIRPPVAHQPPPPPEPPSPPPQAPHAAAEVGEGFGHIGEDLRAGNPFRFHVHTRCCRISNRGMKPIHVQMLVRLPAGGGMFAPQLQDVGVDLQPGDSICRCDVDSATLDSGSANGKFTVEFVGDCP